MLFSVQANAQTNLFSPRDSRNDFSAGFGWMIPLVQGDLGSDYNEGAMTRVDYRHFYQNRAEFRAGLTPGYIYGDGRTHRSSYSVIADGDRYNWSGVKGTEVGSRFCLTADVGTNLSYRIWRFCLNLNPELHYIITNSYNLYSKPDKGDKP